MIGLPGHRSPPTADRSTFPTLVRKTPTASRKKTVTYHPPNRRRNTPNPNPPRDAGPRHPAPGVYCRHRRRANSATTSNAAVPNTIPKPGCPGATVPVSSVLSTVTAVDAESFAEASVAV